MKALGGQDGVLPLLDAHLPDRPSRGNPAWLAMPIAAPIADALSGRPLDDVVSAIATIASTLADLQAKHRLSHRDVKPANLYELDGRWLVGDFGLVTAPDLEELTRTGKPLGPIHFMAYEMIIDPSGADPHPADVYSLGKTLWVLAVEQHFPPSGHQRADDGEHSIFRQRPHRNAAELDRLVEQATSIRPEERPTKEQIAKDLASWSALSKEPVILDVTDIGAKMRTKLAEELNDLGLREQRIEAAHASLRRLAALTAPLNAALRDVHPRAEIDVIGDQLSRNYVLSRPHWGSAEILFDWHRCSIVRGGAGFRKHLFRMARGFELDVKGDVTIRFFVHVGLEGVMQTDFHWMSEPLKAAVGSIELDGVMEEGVRELAARVKTGLEVLEQRLPDHPRTQPDSG